MVSVREAHADGLIYENYRCIAIPRVWIEFRGVFVNNSTRAYRGRKMLSVLYNDGSFAAYQTRRTTL
jgi:hypothetical protein